MKKDNYGVWEITVQPFDSGVCAIPHDSKVKVIYPHLLITLILIHGQISMILPSGARIERLPAWIKRVTQDLTVSPVYEGRFWNPSTSEKYVFKHRQLPKPTNIRIYEAHVGISTSEPRVGIYTEFTKNTLPRIKDLGYNVIQLMAIMEHPYYACKSLVHESE
jgi:1,4-alpha-glucan branching enzyme